MLVPEEQLPLELDAIREPVVEDRHDHKVVLCDVADRGPTLVKVGLVSRSDLFVDTILESRGRERMVQRDRGEDSAGEVAEVAVVEAFDVVAKEEDGPALEPGKREGRVGMGREAGGGEGEGFWRIPLGSEGRSSQGGHELRRRTGGVVGEPLIPLGDVLIRRHSSVLRIRLRTAAKRARQPPPAQSPATTAHNDTR